MGKDGIELDAKCVRGNVLCIIPTHCFEETTLNAINAVFTRQLSFTPLWHLLGKLSNPSKIAFVKIGHKCTFSVDHGPMQAVHWLLKQLSRLCRLESHDQKKVSEAPRFVSHFGYISASSIS